jgi:sigma-E factor negative regulatory protein RseB
VRRASVHIFFLSILLSASVADGVADPFLQDELKWLQTMAFAAHQTDYSGTFVYQYGSHVETSRITHVVDNTGEHGRLESLDGVRREVIRHNDQVWCYVGERKVRMELYQGARVFPVLLPEQLNLLNDNYVIKKGGEGRMAGFHAHAMTFQPKDDLRYVHKIWADSDSGLLLRSEVLGEHGEIIEQYSFTQLTMGANIDRKWIDQDKSDIVPIAQSHTTPSKSIEAVKVSGWQVDAMPPGFKKITEIRRTLRNKKMPAIQMVFSDGLAGISVFIEGLADNPDAIHGLTSQGAVQIYSRVVDGEHLVTVVGEVPPRTVIQIADSVRQGG